MAFSCLDLNAYTKHSLWPLPDFESIIASVGGGKDL